MGMRFDSRGLERRLYPARPVVQLLFLCRTMSHTALCTYLVSWHRVFGVRVQTFIQHTQTWQSSVVTRAFMYYYRIYVGLPGMVHDRTSCTQHTGEAPGTMLKGQTVGGPNY